MSIAYLLKKDNVRMAIRKKILTAEEIMLYKLQSVLKIIESIHFLPQAILAQLVEQLIRNQ